MVKILFQKYPLFKNKLSSLDVIVFYRTDLSMSLRIVDPSFLNAPSSFFLLHTLKEILFVHLSLPSLGLQAPDCPVFFSPNTQ